MIGWLLRLVIAAVFARAAIQKFRAGSDPVIDDVRLPVWLRSHSTQVLIALEAVIAVLLVIPQTAVVGGIGTAVLGAAFVVVLSRRWHLGQHRQHCACFGTAREQPAWILVTRAGAIVLCGILIAVGLTPSLSSGSLIGLGFVALTLVVAVLCVLVLALYRQVGVLERRLGPRSALELADEGPPFGVRAPELEELTGIGSELVVFGSESCRLCRELAPGLRALARDGNTIYGIDEFMSPDVFSRFRVPGTPYVVHTVDGVVVAKGLVNTLEQIEELLETGLERAYHAQ